MLVRISSLQLPAYEVGGAFYRDFIAARVEPVLEYAMLVVPPTKLVFRSLNYPPYGQDVEDSVRKWQIRLGNVYVVLP